MTKSARYVLMVRAITIAAFCMAILPTEARPAERGDRHAQAPALSPVKPAAIYHGSRRAPLVALTFDACERINEKTGYDRRIIDILTRTRTPATFFLGGRWMLSHPEETRELARVPFFELANHSYSHPDMRALGDAALRYEIQETQNIMHRIAGRQGTLFRAPFGWYNKRLVAAAGALGLRLIQWDVVSGDPDPRVSAAMIRRFVLGGARFGSIAIMHVNGRGHHTHAALPGIIDELRRRGFRFVTVSELLSVAP